MFDFNSNQLQKGSEIVNSKGVVVYTVLDAVTPEWEAPCSQYLNSGLWVKVLGYDGEVFSQPVQWFNAVIGANVGMVVRQVNAV